MLIGMIISSAVVIRPTWTTAHLAQAALEDGHRVRFIEAHDVEVTGQGRLVTRAYVLDSPCKDATELANKLRTNQLTRRYIEVATLDMMLLRANPLTNSVMSIALMAQDRGVRVINDPAGMARTRSKAWLATLTDVPKPLTLVTTEPASATLFAENQPHGVVIKPSLGSGGRGVRLVLDPRKVNRTFTEVRCQVPGPVVIQAYIPEADLGEKRVFWVDGEVVGTYLRTRAPGVLQHNVQQGGTPVATELSDSDIAICESIGPHLKRNGIVIAGLDIIGSALIECNTVNPGGIYYAESFRTVGGLSLATHAFQILLRPWTKAEAKHA
jgi:glutathione synthase